MVILTCDCEVPRSVVSWNYFHIDSQHCVVSHNCPALTRDIVFDANNVRKKCFIVPLFFAVSVSVKYWREALSHTSLHLFIHSGLCALFIRQGRHTYRCSLHVNFHCLTCNFLYILSPVALLNHRSRSFSCQTDTINVFDANNVVLFLSVMWINKYS